MSILLCVARSRWSGETAVELEQNNLEALQLFVEAAARSNHAVDAGLHIRFRFHLRVPFKLIAARAERSNSLRRTPRLLV